MEALSDLWPIKKDKHEINHQLWESRLLRSRESPSPAGLYITPRTNKPSDSTVTAWPQKSPQINACTAEYPDCFNVSNSVVNPSNLCISTHITWVIWIVSLLPNSVILQDNFEYCRYFVQDIVGVKQYMVCHATVQTKMRPEPALTKSFHNILHVYVHVSILDQSAKSAKLGLVNSPRAVGKITVVRIYLNWY